MALLSLTDSADEVTVYVNPTQVAYVRDYAGDGEMTEIVFGGAPGDDRLRITVKEKVADVVSRLDLHWPRSS